MPAIAPDFHATLNIYLDVSSGRFVPCLFRRDRYSTQTVALQFVAGDIVQLRLHLIGTPATLGGAAPIARWQGSITWAMKAEATATADVLALADSFTLLAAAPDDEAGEYYAATLNLNTTTLLAAMAAANGRALKTRLDIEFLLRDTDNVVVSRLTFGNTISVEPQAWTGAESQPPADALPTYPAPGEIPSQSQINQSISNGLADITTTIPGIVASAVLAQSGQLLTGTTNIPSAAGAIAITFPTPFSATPNITNALIAKPDAASNDIFVATIYSISPTGFTASLSAPPNNPNYTLHWAAILPPTAT
jgi:hypothetical protein